jgi:hypothetical protein
MIGGIVHRIRALINGEKGLKFPKLIKSIGATPIWAARVVAKSFFRMTGILDNKVDIFASKSISDSVATNESIKPISYIQTGLMMSINAAETKSARIALEARPTL